MGRGIWMGAAALLIVLPAGVVRAQVEEPATEEPAAQEEAGAVDEAARDEAAAQGEAGAVDEAARDEAAVQGEAGAVDEAARDEAAAQGEAGAVDEAARDEAARDEAEPGAQAIEPDGDAAAEAPAAAPREIEPREAAPAQPQVAQPQRRRSAGPGTPAADGAWRQLLSPELDVAQRAELAAERLTVAERALAGGDPEVARSALRSATQTLQAILTEGPGAALASELGDAAARLQLDDAPAFDLDALVAQVQALEPVLPGEVLTLTRDAQRQLQRGDRDGASFSLLGARGWVVADLALLPVEEAYARSRSALAEVEAGNLQLALSLVQGMPASIARLRADAPLVPVRLRLRAAANQASERRWAQAEVLLNEAGAELVSMREGASPRLARRVDSLNAQVGALQERLTTGREPSAARIRQVAEAAGGVPAG